MHARNKGTLPNEDGEGEGGENATTLEAEQELNAHFHSKLTDESH